MTSPRIPTAEVPSCRLLAALSVWVDVEAEAVLEPVLEPEWEPVIVLR